MQDYKLSCSRNAEQPINDGHTFVGSQQYLSPFTDHLLNNTRFILCRCVSDKRQCYEK